MISKFKYALLICLLIPYLLPAQESMMPEISYPYIEKLVAAAKANYPKMKAYEHKLKIAEMNIKRTKIDWLGIFNFTYLYSPTSTLALYNSTSGGGSTNPITPGLLNGYQVGVSTSLGSILQRPGQIKAAKEEYILVQLDQEEYNLSITAMVQQRYYQYLQQLILLNWKAKDLGNAESSLKDIKYKFEKGEATFENYNKVLGLYSTGIQGKIQAEAALLTAKSNLEEIIGVKLESIK